MEPYLAWSRDGLHFLRPDANITLLNHSSIDMERLHSQHPEAPYCFDGLHVTLGCT